MEDHTIFELEGIYACKHGVPLESNPYQNFNLVPTGKPAPPSEFDYWREGWFFGANDGYCTGAN